MVANYLQELNIQDSNVSQMTTSALTKIIKEWDTERWLKGLKNKETLREDGKFKTRLKKKHVLQTIKSQNFCLERELTQWS